MDELAIMCDEIIESHDNKTKTIPTYFNKAKTSCKTQTIIYYLHFYELL